VASRGLGLGPQRRRNAENVGKGLELAGRRRLDVDPQEAVAAQRLDGRLVQVDASLLAAPFEEQAPGGQWIEPRSTAATAATRQTAYSRIRIDVSPVGTVAVRRVGCGRFTGASVELGWWQ
jgi:hypothetical protein